MEYHTCWAVKPTDGQPGMPLADLVARLAGAFPTATFDPESGRQAALQRLAALQAVTTPVPLPEAMLSYYRDAHPVDVALTDGDTALRFTVWPDPDGPVSRVLVWFITEAEQREGCVLLVRMAEAQGWEAEDVSDEVE